MKKIVTTCLVMSFLLVACGGKSSDLTSQKKDDLNDENKVSIESIDDGETVNVSDNEVLEALSKINKADELKIKEAIFSLGKKKYTISVKENDEFIEVAEIKGKYAKITGDVFTMRDMDGNILATEKQIKRWGVKLNRLAVVYDHDDNIIGYIGEELDKMLSIGSLLHFYDSDKNEIGIFDQVNISLTGKKFNILKTDSEEEDYKISKDLMSTSDTYKIEVIDSSVISPIEVIFSVAIDDAISDAAEANKKKKKKNTN